MDLRYALRTLAKDPSFAIVAVLVMALGIGANTAVFTVVDSVLLKPLGYRDADRIVTLHTLWKKNGHYGQVSAPDYHDWRGQSTAFSAMADYDGEETPVATPSGAEYTNAAEVDSGFFDVFQTDPAAGRFLTEDDRKTGTNAVISFAYANRFGGAQAALGRQIRMLDHSFTVVGVAPPGFDFPEKSQIWIAANSIFPETTSRSAHNYRVVARLRPGVSVEQAQAQMTAIGMRLEQQYPASDSGKNVAVVLLRDRLVGNVKFTLYLLLGSVALVLLIACANMANLLLAKATARSREIAVRAAVGASRFRILRQLIIESLVLAALSGAAGLVLAWWGASALMALAPANVPRLTELGIDWRVLAFTLAVSIAATLLFGVAPAFHAARVDLNNALKQGGGRANVTGSHRLRGALVVAEIALSVVLVAGAGLLIRSFAALENVPLGFRPQHVLVMEASVPASDRAGQLRALQFFESMRTAAAALPGVIADGVTLEPPGQSASDGSYYVDHLPRETSVNAPQAIFSVISTGVFQTLGIPLKAGRDFSAADTYDAPFTAIINESFARQSFTGENPIGHFIYCGFDSDKPMRIVGIVADSRTLGPALPPRPELYMPYLQHPRADLNVLVRTAGNPAALSETLRRIARSRSAEVPVKFTTMEVRLSENVAAPRFRMFLLGIFAALALCLAMAGVYGVMAYSVGQRSGEMGLRMALGATPRHVQGLVLRQALRLVALGLVFGLAGAALATRLLASMLFEIKPADPATYAAAAGALALAALAASYFPARRATRIDPLEALRQE